MQKKNKTTLKKLVKKEVNVTKIRVRLFKSVI